MLDIKWIKENQTAFDSLLKKRGVIVDSKELLNLDAENKKLKTSIQQLHKSRNDKSKELAILIEKEEEKLILSTKLEVKNINDQINNLSKKLKVNTKYNKIMDSIPNLPAEEVPYGLDDSMNQLISQYGQPRFFQNPKDHTLLGAKLEMMEFKQTAQISGSRFVTLKSKLAKLERAIANFMLDIHTEKYGYMEISTPYLVRSSAMYNAGQLPKFADDSYTIEGEDYRLIPTAEVSLTNLVSNSIQIFESLPQRYVSYTQCFRSEAGSAGKDTKGMFRNHQFGKVELVSITSDDQSRAEHERMLSASEEVLKRIDIPYRVMLVCAGDMGFSASKTYDIEVWLPGQNKYREIASISNCCDFQARRMQARYRELKTKRPKFVHTLNGSGLAVGRTLIAILENYQKKDGSITIPDVLVPYMSGEVKIEKNN